ncbi:hypothetical protein BSKO_08654 [Bryopsis sp. KO-2023]|nr:hypothetical protein BSKO_08654 [Bryopsis sp. KO-2023]
MVLDTGLEKSAMSESHFEKPESLIKHLKESREVSRSLRAATKVTELARNEATRKSMIKAGAIPALIKLLRSPSRDLRITSSHALCNIAISKSAHQEILRNGGIPLLIQSMLTGQPDEVSAGGFALANLARVSQLASSILDDAGGVGILTGLLKAWDHSHAREACGDLLLKLSLNSGIEDKIASNGGVEALAKLLSDEDVRLGSKEKALGALYNVCSTNREFCSRAADAGAIPAVVYILRKGSANGKFSGLLMTKTFTVNEFEQEVYQAGGVEAVAKLLDADLSSLQHAEPVNFRQEVAKTLYELSVGREDIKERITEAGVVPTLVALLDSGGNHLRSAALKVLYGLAVNNKAKSAIVQAGAAPRLVALLRKNGRDSEFAATAIRNLVFDNDRTAAMLVKDGAVGALLVVVQRSSSLDARKQALAAMVNLSNEPGSKGPETICKTSAVEVFAQEVMRFSSSRKEDEFQWAAWCAVVLHNLMEYDECLPWVYQALCNRVSLSPMKNKLKDMDKTAFKQWMAELAAESDLDYL